jgi:hypothetical protein
MKDFNGSIQYKDKEYKLVFNLNVMEAIQNEYETIDKWGALTDGTDNGEPNAKAVIFGFREMINEGIEIDNDENGTDEPLLTEKKVGRIITDVGLANATKALNQTVINSTKDDSGKNA